MVSIFLIYLLREKRDEISLQHWFEKCIDCSMLVVLHALEEFLNKFDLILLGPGRKIIHAYFTLFQIPRQQTR